MTRTWKFLTVQTLIAGALTACSLQAADSDNPAKPLDAAAIAKKLDNLQKRIEGLLTAITNLDARGQKDIADLKTELKKEIETAARASDLRLSAVKGDVEDLRKQVVQLQKDVDGLRTRTSASTQISQYPPLVPAASNGRVRLVNTYFEPVTVVVNRQAFQLLPGETRMIDAVPAGTFTYEVLDMRQTPQVRPLSAAETFTITVHPL